MRVGSQADEIATHIDEEHPGRAAEEVQVAIGLIADALDRIANSVEQIEKHLKDIGDAARTYDQIHA